jgi:GNAT superfamily N-acetyltransferase
VEPRPPLELRRFADADLDETVRVWRASRLAAFPWLRPSQLHTAAEDRAFFARVLARETEVWLAGRGGRVEGLLCLRCDFVEQLFVGPDAQGTGAGSALLDRAKERSPSGLHLYTFQRNTRARGFYERRGFRLLRWGISPPPENEPDVFYAWRPGGGGLAIR